MNTIVTKTEVNLDTKPARTKAAKPIFCITDGKIYASGLDAAKAIGVDPTCISHVCLGKLKTVKGKKYCFVSEMQARILDISNAMQDALKDANAYRAIKAEEERKAACEKKKNELHNKITAREEQLRKEAEELGTMKAMLAAMEAEFNT
jgi:hypothetical protein